jgi:large subunit ribosomal protein L29
MKARELRDMSVEELESKRTELERERFNLRFSSATQTVENPIRFRTIRRDIARINTILRERAAGAKANAAAAGAAQG